MELLSLVSISRGGSRGRDGKMEELRGVVFPPLSSLCNALRRRRFWGGSDISHEGDRYDYRGG